MTVCLQLLHGLSLSVATTAAESDVSVHGAKDGPDPQECGDLERQRKNLLVVMSVFLVDGLKQSSSRCGHQNKLVSMLLMQLTVVILHVV